MQTVGGERGSWEEGDPSGELAYGKTVIGRPNGVKGSRQQRVAEGRRAQWKRCHTREKGKVPPREKFRGGDPGSVLPINDARRSQEEGERV